MGSNGSGVLSPFVLPQGGLRGRSAQVVVISDRAYETGTGYQ